MFLNPSIGYRFNFGRKAGLNIGIGWSFRAIRGDIYKIDYDEEKNSMIFTPIGRKTFTYNYLSFRIGFDF